MSSWSNFPRSRPRAINFPREKQGGPMGWGGGGGGGLLQGCELSSRRLRALLVVNGALLVVN